MGLMDSLLDSSLDDVETAAEFVDIPNGVYVLRIKKAEAKDMEAKGDKPAGVRVNIIYEVVETVELADGTKEPVDVGSMASEGFNLNEQGLPFFKRYLANIFGDTTGISLGELITALNEITITAIVKNREVNGRDYMGTSRQAPA